MITKTSYKTLNQLTELLKNITDPTLVLISKSAAKRWKLEDALESSLVLWISKIEPNPTPSTLYSALNRIRENNFTLKNIIAIGGGSTIDLAKGIIALYPVLENNITTDTIRQSIIDKTYLNASRTDFSFTAIPSTAGTGSEATQWATIWDDKSAAKYSIDAPWLYPNSVMLIPELTLNLSAKLTAATGLDAVSHAVEAYWANASDSLSQALSIRALEILVPNLTELDRKVSNDNLIWRESLVTGAFIAGLSFSRTRTTAGHSISYPLTSLFGIEHGFATTIAMAEIAERNSRSVDLTEMLAIFKPYGGIQGWLDNVTSGIISLKLSSFGVNKKDISTIVENAFTGGRMDNNPVSFSKEDVRDILISVL